MKDARVNWRIEANVECPHCDSNNDFMNVDEHWEWCKVGENVEKFETPCEIECSYCGQMINVVGSDY